MHSLCSDCFVAHELDRFETSGPCDFNGVSLAEIEEKIRFRKAQPGDHIFCPFQCPWCQSFNICRKVIQKGNIEDDAFEAIYTRAILDTFCDHSSQMSAGHVWEVKFATKYAAMLDI